MTSTDTNVKKESQHIYPILLPKATDKQHYSILNFRESDNVDFNNVATTSIKRENNLRDFKSAYGIDTTPKFGEGSQFGKEAKDEARRKKFGMLARKYNPNDQPWIITLGSGKEARRFKGTKCRDLLENASYFAFIPDSDGTFTALPIDEWCDCKYLPKYKTLSIEEAEEEFTRRDKVHNKYAIMLNKRLKEEAEEASESKSGGEKGVSDDDESEDEVKEEKEKKAKAKGKKAKRDDDDEKAEEDGDVDEGQELDYITDESSGEEDKKEIEEEGDDDEDFNGNDSEEEEDENKEEDQNSINPINKNTDSSDTSSDSDIDNDPNLPIVVGKNTSKRSHSDSSSSVPPKKQKVEIPPIVSSLPPSQPTSVHSKASTKPSSKPTDSSSLEKQVRRYLQRKPMTSKDLIHKLRKTCASKEQLMEDIVAVLMRINPTQTKVNDKLYFTLKATSGNDEEGKGGE